MYFGSLGDTAAWGEGVLPRVYVTPKEVYLWRAKLSGADFQEPKDGAYFIQAIGKKIAGFDIRGICIVRGATPSVDVVFTVNDYLFDVWDNAQDVSNFVSQDMDLRARFPGVGIISPQMLQLTGPPASVDFWVQAPIAWSNSIGPQSAFTNLQCIYEGIADDGLNLKVWSNPIVLGPSSGGAQKQSDSSGHAGLWVLGGVLAAAFLGKKLLG